MKYFKHFPTSDNSKIEMLIDEYGLIGYGFYFKHLEFITANIEVDNKKEWGFLPAEYTTEYLCKKLNIDKQLYIDILKACAKLNLLQLINGKIYCEQVLTRGDDYLGRIVKTTRRKTTNKLRSNSVVTPEKTPLEEEQEEDKEKEEESNKKYPLSYLSDIPETDLEEFVEKFLCTKPQVKSKANAVIDWCESEGKKKKNYKSTLSNWLRKDYGERPPKPKQFDAGEVAPDISEEQRQKNRDKIAHIRQSIQIKTL